MFKKWTSSPFFMNFYLVLIFLLPNTIYAYAIMYFFLIVSMKFKFSWKIIIAFTIFLSFVFNVNGYYDIKDYLIALNIGFLLMFFPFFYHKIILKIHFVYFIAIIILLSQISFIFHLQVISSFFESIYTSANSEDDFTKFIVGAERNGGLYFNPNQASKYLTSLLTILLVLKFKNWHKFIISGLILTSVILTGSRTGFAITLAILLSYTLFINKNKYISVFLVILGVITTIFIGTNSRSFQFGETGSADYKLIAILEYWTRLSWSGDTLRLFFGNFTANFSLLAQKYKLTSEFGFDADIGMALSSYGLIFIFFYITFFSKFFKLINKKNFIVLIPFLLWPFTSTILFSVKTSIVYFSVLAIVLSNTSNKNRVHGNKY